MTEPTAKEVYADKRKRLFLIIWRTTTSAQEMDSAFSLDNIEDVRKECESIIIEAEKAIRLCDELREDSR